MIDNQSETGSATANGRARNRPQDRFSLLVIHTSLSLAGGAEEYIFQTLPELEEAGFRIRVFYSEPDPDPTLSERFDTVKFPDGYFNLHYRNTPLRTAKFVRAMREFSPDLVWVHEIANPTLVPILTSQSPAVRSVHGMRITCYNARRILHRSQRTCDYRFGPACFFRAYHERCTPRRPDLNLKTIYRGMKLLRSTRKFDALIIPSNFMRDLLIKNDPRLVRKLYRLYWYVDTDKFTPPTSPAPAGEPVLLFAGRIVREKGIFEFLDVIDRIDVPCRGKVVGRGEDLAEVRRFAERCRHPIEFIDHTPRSEMPRMYREAAITVVPVLWPEPMGMVGPESLACGTPVIGYDCGGVPEWLRDGETGFLVPRGDRLLLAKRAETLLSNPSLRQQFGRSGRKLVEQRFSRKVHLESLVPFLIRLSQRGRDRRGVLQQ